MSAIRPHLRRVIIAGSRHGTHGQEFALAITHWLSLYGTPEVVLCGCCLGVDEEGAAWAAQQGIPVERYPADWKRYGRDAGPLRNAEMARKADGALIITYPRSRGSYDMLRRAERAGLTVLLHKMKEESERDR